MATAPAALPRRGIAPAARDARHPSRTLQRRPQRRIGAESSGTRAVLLDAAERLMREEGYAAVTSRKVAAAARLTPQLVHYYFRTMDDMFLALWRRFVRQNLERQARAVASPRPLGALWEFTCHGPDIVLQVEFMALAHHRKAIRRELAQDGDRFRRTQTAILTRLLGERRLEAGRYPPEVMAVLLTCLSRGLGMEMQVGMSAGHSRTLRHVREWLERLEPAARRGARGAGGGRRRATAPRPARREPLRRR